MSFIDLEIIQWQVYHVQSRHQCAGTCFPNAMRCCCPLEIGSVQWGEVELATRTMMFLQQSCDENTVKINVLSLTLHGFQLFDVSCTYPPLLHSRWSAAAYPDHHHRPRSTLHVFMGPGERVRHQVAAGCGKGHGNQSNCQCNDPYLFLSWSLLSAWTALQTSSDEFCSYKLLRENMTMGTLYRSKE